LSGGPAARFFVSGVWAWTALWYGLPVHAVLAETGSQVCANCHRDIYNAWQATGMARSSGPVTGIESEGTFAPKPAGVQYRVQRQNGAAVLHFDIGGIHGSRGLEYFIGSGTVGRSYLYMADGFLFEAPVSWYALTAAWDLSPGYEQYDRLFLTRPIDSVCLQCHASQVQPVPGTANGFRSPPFREGGVSCERCHGPGDQHVLGRGKMIDPAALPPDRRDSICAQCHLSGEARILRAGASGSFRPGDRLADSVVVFEWSGDPGMNVTSHFETLARSACKQASGDRLWCGTCHDPHRGPAEAEKATYYRARCLQCHQTAQCARGPDCAGCHMPKKPVRDVQHSAYTDHAIRRHAIRKPGDSVAAASERGVDRNADRKLTPFGTAPGTTAGNREYGLAYATQPGYRKQAIAYLERAPQDDAEVLANLAYLYESAGDLPKAVPLYEKALKLDPSQVAAAVNLGNARIKRNQAQEAIALWQHALSLSPGLETVRLSLAVAQYRTGDIAAGDQSLRALLDLNPGATAARRLLHEMQARR
jgi:hypothetical protein